MPRPPLAVMSPPSNAEIDVSDMKVGSAASVGGVRTRRSSRISKHGRKLGRKRPRLNEARFPDCWCFLATLRRSDDSNPVTDMANLSPACSSDGENHAVGKGSLPHSGSDPDNKVPCAPALRAGAL